MLKVEVGFLYRIGALTTEEVKPADGKKFKLEELQKLVGGYIEAVPYANPVAYCNEEGRLNNLLFNELASGAFKQFLVGDVIQVRKQRGHDYGE